LLHFLQFFHRRILSTTRKYYIGIMGRHV